MVWHSEKNCYRFRRKKKRKAPTQSGIEPKGQKWRVEKRTRTEWRAMERGREQSKRQRNKERGKNANKNPNIQGNSK